MHERVKFYIWDFSQNQNFLSSKFLTRWSVDLWGLLISFVDLVLCVYEGLCELELHAWVREDILGILLSSSSCSEILHFLYYHVPRGGKCSIGGIVPNTAFIFRAFVVAPRTQSYLCIFSSFYLALNLNIQVVNSLCYPITWNFLSKYWLID